MKSVSKPVWQKCYLLERYISVSTFLQPIGDSNHDNATLWHKTEEATGGVLLEKAFLEISPNLQENTCARVSILIKLQAWGHNFIKTEAVAKVFSLEFCEISKNAYFTEYVWATASNKRYIMVRHLMNISLTVVNNRFFWNWW